MILTVRPLLHSLFAPAIEVAASLSYRDAYAFPYGWQMLARSIAVRALSRWCAVPTMEAPHAARGQAVSTPIPAETIESKQTVDIPLNGGSYTDLVAAQAGGSPETTSGADNTNSGVGAFLDRQGIQAGGEGIIHGFPSQTGVEGLFFNGLSIGPNPFSLTQVNDTCNL